LIGYSDAETEMGTQWDSMWAMDFKGADVSVRGKICTSTAMLQ
jgi:hypothetical protein